MQLPAAKVPNVVAYRLLSYDVAILQDQIALTLQYATTRAEAAVGKRRILRLAMPPEAALRAAMGFIEATRSQVFDVSEKSTAEH